MDKYVVRYKPIKYKYMTRSQVQSWCPRPIEEEVVGELNDRLPQYAQNMYKHAVGIQEYMNDPLLSKEHIPQIIDVCMEAPWTKTMDDATFRSLLDQQPTCAEDFLPALQEHVERALSTLMEILAERVVQEGRETVRKEDFLKICAFTYTVDSLRTPEEMEEIRRKYVSDPKPLKPPLVHLVTQYNKMKIPELKVLLKERNLPVSGKKADLVRRLAKDVFEEN